MSGTRKIFVAIAFALLSSAALSEPQVSTFPPAIKTAVDAPASRSTAATYYLSVNGEDTNPGTLERPFRTLQKAVPLLKAEDTLVVRAGTYNTGGFTKANADTLFTTGESWEKPIRIHAYQNEKVTFVRDLPPNIPHTMEQVRAGVHAPTREQCNYYAKIQPGYFLPYPEQCWAGSPSYGYLWLMQDDTGGTTPPILNLANAQHMVQYLEFKNINFDGRGIARNIISTSTMANKDPTAKNIRILNADIGYAAASCFSQPSASDYDSKGELNRSNIQVVDSKIHHCGIPFDYPARKDPNAKFLHGFYMHIGGNECMRCEIYENAGGGFEPDGPDNKLIDSYIHDNACLGAQLGGGDNSIYTGNVFYNNGCGEIQLLSGKGHLFKNNTLYAGPSNRHLGAQITFAESHIDANIIQGYEQSILSIQPWGKPNRITNNFYTGKFLEGGKVPPIKNGNIQGKDALFVDPTKGDFRLKPGSPAIGKGAK